MIYILISVCCSVLVSVLLKLAKRYHIDINQAITWNYSAAVVLSWFFLKPRLDHLSNAPVAVYAVLGILLPLLFVLIGVSIKFNGIARTDVVQRLSLFIPIVASFLLFHERLNPLKIAGLCLGIAAIFCLLPWQQRKGNKNAPGHSWVYLFIVFVGMGIIDVLFKQVAVLKEISYTTSLFIVFVIALVISLARLLYLVMLKKIRFSWMHVPVGWVLGLINFGNILFYLKAHQALVKNPSLVFSAMNIGVVALGTLIGLYLFKERLSLLNKIGIVLAILAIVIITMTQHAV